MNFSAEAPQTPVFGDFFVPISLGVQRFHSIFSKQFFPPAVARDPVLCISIVKLDPGIGLWE